MHDVTKYVNFEILCIIRSNRTKFMFIVQEIS